jgi:hypothetical protein
MSDDGAIFHAAFAQRGAIALFATELRRAVRERIATEEFEATLAAHERAGVVRIVTKSAPDPHLADADLRIVALERDDADLAIEETWRAWLTEFLRAHRCT